MNIKNIKRYLFYCLGKKITVIYYGSRNRKERFDGILDKIYDNLFVVRLANGDVKSFSFIDVLTKTIQIYI